MINVKRTVEEWKKDKKFMEFLSNNGVGEDIFDNFDALKQKHTEYEAQQGRENPKVEESNPAEILIIGSEDTNKSNNEDVSHDDATISAWKKWASEHNYTFEDTKEKEYNYSFNLYKNEEDFKNKTPSTIVKYRDNNIFVKSDDLNVYREIIKQAKQNNFSSVKFMENLKDEQKKMLLIACLETDMPMKNPPLIISTKDPLYNNLSDETKEKVKEHNYNSTISAVDERIKKYKEENPDKAFSLIKEMENINIVGNKGLLGAMLLESAERQNVKYEVEGFFDVPESELATVPAKKLDALKRAVKTYNKQYASNLYIKDCKELTADRDAEVDIRARGDATAQAIAYAICTKEGIKMKNIPDMFTSNKIEFLPKNVQDIIEKHNQEYRDKVKDKEHGDEGKPTDETAKPQRNKRGAKKTFVGKPRIRS